jgi:hypothetical protein
VKQYKEIVDLIKSPRITLDGIAGFIRLPDSGIASIVVSWGGGWEHVSVSPLKEYNTPTWADMCYIKELFFNDDEVVVQYHPRKADYVNFVSNCLHLWRPINGAIPTPPRFYV